MNLKGIYETAFNMVVLQEFCKDCDKDPLSGECKENFCYEKGVKVIYEAIENQIPVKPIFVKDVCEVYYKCPVCDSQFDEYILDINYCEYCGSKLDWSDAKYSYLKSDTFRTE